MTQPANRDGEPIPDAWDDLIDALPPASEDRGVPGHDLSRAVARRAQAVRLRLSGATYEQIAQTAGYSHRAAARNAVRRSLTRYEAENVAELRALENARMDADEMVLRGILANSAVPVTEQIQAVNARIRLSARRAALNGLDAPTQVQVSGADLQQLDDALTLVRDVVMGQVVTDDADTDPDAGPRGLPTAGTDRGGSDRPAGPPDESSSSGV